MNYNFKQQLPYVAILCVLSWAYMCVFPPVYFWTYMIAVVPMLVGSLWLYKMVATPDNQFTILSVFKKHAMIIVLAISYYGYDYYIKHHTISAPFMALVCVMTVFSLTILERSIYE